MNSTLLIFQPEIQLHPLVSFKFKLDYAGLGFLSTPTWDDTTATLDTYIHLVSTTIQQVLVIVDFSFRCRYPSHDRKSTQFLDFVYSNCLDSFSCFLTPIHIMFELSSYKEVNIDPL